MDMRVLIILGISLCLASIACGLEGLATFCGPPYVPSACFGYKDNSSRHLVAAVGKELWTESRTACGNIYEVISIGGVNPVAPHPCFNGSSVAVQIVDYCPRCPGPINVSRLAFAIIADLDAGVIKVDYRKFVKKD